MILLDVDYIIRNNKPVIRMWCKNEDGSTTVKEDSNFEPYFYAWHPDLDMLQSKVTSMVSSKMGEEIKAKKIELVNKKVEGKETLVLKIYTQLPSHVPILRNRIKKIDGSELFEADLLFTLRYLVDKELKPFGEINDN